MYTLYLYMYVYIESPEYQIKYQSFHMTVINYSYYRVKKDIRLNIVGGTPRVSLRYQDR